MTVVTEGDKYTDVLPSLNLALEFPHDMKLRFGAAITVARPRLDDLGGGASYTVDQRHRGRRHSSTGRLTTGKRNGGGNPKLKPWKANTFDLSFEKYFGDNKGYVSAAVYYKDLKTYIFNAVDGRGFLGACRCPRSTPDDPTRLPTTAADANRMGVSTLKANGSGGYVRGYRAHGVDSLLVVLGCAGWLRLHRQRRQRTVLRSRSTTWRRRFRACPRRSSIRRCTTRSSVSRHA